MILFIAGGTDQGGELGERRKMRDERRKTSQAADLVLVAQAVSPAGVNAGEHAGQNANDLM